MVHCILLKALVHPSRTEAMRSSPRIVITIVQRLSSQAFSGFFWKPDWVTCCSTQAYVEKQKMDSLLMSCPTCCARLDSHSQLVYIYQLVCHAYIYIVTECQVCTYVCDSLKSAHMCVSPYILKRCSRGPKLGTYSDWGLSSVLVINKHLSHHERVK